jgi:hypothetical protein
MVKSSHRGPTPDILLWASSMMGAQMFRYLIAFNLPEHLHQVAIRIGKLVRLAMSAIPVDPAFTQSRIGLAAPSPPDPGGP